jgi:hypothetical protein
MTDLEYSLIRRDAAVVALSAPRPVTSLVRSLLSPYFQMEPSSRPQDGAWTVLVGQEPQRGGRLEEITSRPGGEPESRILVDGTAKQLFVAQPEDDEWRAQNAVRLVRILVRLQYFERGSLFIDGSMVTVGEKGVGFVGRKRCGKTSSILSAIIHGRGAYVTNSDLELHPGDHGWEALGWPRAISVRKDTFEQLRVARPDLAINLSGLSHPANATLDQLLSKQDEPHGMVFMYATELAQQLQCPIATQAQARMLVFPEFMPLEERGARLSKLTAGEALERLKQTLDTNPGRHSEFLLPYFQLPGKDSLLAKLARVAHEIPCYELRQSFRSLEDGSRQVLETLRGL